MAEHRRHHFVPEFYLAGFTPSGSRDDYLQVIDQETGSVWRARPEKVAHQRDLYRVESTDDDPNVIEKAFADLEGQVATVIRDFELTGAIPTDDSRDQLMAFISLLATRVPRHRANITKFIGQLAKDEMRMKLATPERWSTQVTRMKAAGIELPPSAEDYEGMKRFVESDEYTVDLSNTRHVDLLLKGAEAILPSMMARRWSFLQAPDDSRGFICSDWPVGLIWTKEMRGFHSPGFALSDTEVSVPLTRQWALIGRFDDNEGLFDVTPKTVAAINSRTCVWSKQVYHPYDDFDWTMRNGKIGTLEDLMVAIQAGAKASKEE